MVSKRVGMVAGGVVAGRRSSGVSRRRAAFTLIEVMIVILIIVALSAIAGVAVFQQLERAKERTTTIQLRSIEEGLKLFSADFNRFPTTEEGIAVLWDKSKLGEGGGMGSEMDLDAPMDMGAGGGGSSGSEWTQYMAQPVPNDGWGRPWKYEGAAGDGLDGFDSGFEGFGDESGEPQGPPYKLWSVGKNGRDEEGQGDDIPSWDASAEGGDFFADDVPTDI